MQKGKPAQFLDRGGQSLHFGSRMGHESVEGGIDGRHEDLFLVAEVEIDRAISHACARGDIGDTRRVKPSLGKYGDSGIQDSLVLFRAAAGWVPRICLRFGRISLRHRWNLFPVKVLVLGLNSDDGHHHHPYDRYTLLLFLLFTQCLQSLD
jgi:hypothetical protein